MRPGMISIQMYEPLWIGSTWLGTLEIPTKAWMHTIQAFGGYWSAQFSLTVDRDTLDEWIASGLGRHIVVYDDSQSIIWEGFVNLVTSNLGPLSVVRGPLMDVANRVRVVYSTVDMSTTPPTVGVRATTADADDADSQALWGIIPKVLSTGGVDEDNNGEATQIRDAFIAEHAWPKTTQDWSNESAGVVSLSVQALGYAHWLNWPYTDRTASFVNANAKIVLVLADTPNAAWLTYGTTYVDTNTLQVPTWEDEDRIALNVIQNITARGDASLNRWLFGVYANREAYYYQAPTDTAYLQRLLDQGVRIETYSGQTEVYPFAVMPGQWMLFPDFLVGRTLPQVFREDPRLMFIETARYRAPWGLTLQGGDVDKLSQLLAQFGLAGVGA